MTMIQNKFAIRHQISKIASAYVSVSFDLQSSFYIVIEFSLARVNQKGVKRTKANNTETVH